MENIVLNARNLDDAQLCELASQQHLLQRLEHFSIYSDRLIVIVGASGSGKSTLIQMLAKNTPEPIQIITANCCQLDWFSSVLSQYGIHSAAGEKSFHFGLGQIEPTRDLLLILDEAEHLTIEQLERLAEKVQNENFHCVLAIDESSHNLLWLKDSPEQVILLQVEPLTEQESRQLLCSVLEIEPHQLPKIMDDSQLQSALDECGGIPGQIIAFARTLLEPHSEASSEKAVSPKTIFMSLAYLSVALVFIFALIYQDDINQWFEPAAKSGSISVNKGNAQTLRQAASADDSPQSDLTVPTKDVAEKKLQEGIDGTSMIESDEDKEPEVVPLNTEKKHPSAPSELQELETAASSLVIEPSKTAETIASNDDISSDKLVAEDSAEPQSSPMSQVTDLSTDNSSVEPRQEQPVVKPITEPLSSSKPHQPFTAAEMQLMQMDARQWMIQLAGFSKLGNAASFIQQHLNTGELHFYRTERNGGDWYVVVLGPFPSKAEAERKRQSLPEVLKSKKPWLKPLSSIHQEIQKPNHRKG
jgi:DamX protein